MSSCCQIPNGSSYNVDQQEKGVITKSVPKCEGIIVDSVTDYFSCQKINFVINPTQIKAKRDVWKV
jgi:hypothetical protein